MSIEFACPQCHRKYRVEDALAGKGAKCSQCGHHMRIPQRGSPEPVAADASEAGSGSWLDDELKATPPPVSQPAHPATCPSCGKPMVPGAVLCIGCGYDARTGATHHTQHVQAAVEQSEPTRRSVSQLVFAPGLLRGTLFSFVAALIGATVWAVLTYFTLYEFSIVAWGLGALVGCGMALGHDDSGDGTWSGIIAAFVSLFGIVAAKFLIIVIFVGAAVATVMGQLDVGEKLDSEEFQRSRVAATLAQEKLEDDGIDPENVTDKQWEDALEKARAEVAEITEAELEASIKALQEVGQSDDAQRDGGAVPQPPPDDGQEPGFITLFFTEMFGPFDSIFILLAFFTAYKLGSGQMTD